MPALPDLLLDWPPYPAAGFARLADRIAALLGTSGDVLHVQGEAIVALEAAATSLARPGLRALNIVTSPYGALFGEWLARSGAEVRNLTAEPGLPIALPAVTASLGQPTDLVALVHAESASGILNPLPEIAALARAKGALVVVDAVASVGGHALPMDELGLDLVVIGPQKSLGGSSGLSAIALGPRAWAAIDREDAPRHSILSLLDHRRDWLERGRGQLPGMPSTLEFHALEAALDRIEAEGLAATIARHARAAAATRAGLTALGLPLWIADPAQASALVTTATLPPGASLRGASPALLEAVSPAIGTPPDVIRFNHTGPRANEAAVSAGLAALADHLGR